MRRLSGVLAAVALGSGLLAVPGVLPEAPVRAEGASTARLGPGPTGVAAPGPQAASGGPTGPTEGSDPTGPAAGPTDPAVAPADAVAGLLSIEVPQAGTGETVVVPGSAPAPGPGPVRTVRVEVEGGLPVDPAVVAGFVLDGLNDPRGWGRDGAMSFARTDGAAEIVVVLASPETSARLCAPLDTGGTLSCRSGPRAIITHHRWVLAHPDYGDDRTAYRRYLVNHEVGHVLGYGHVPCPGPGVPAPVMMQQTKGLLGCAPNPWPHP